MSAGTTRIPWSFQERKQEHLFARHASGSLLPSIVATAVPAQIEPLERRSSSEFS
jgi:hypothetical protein